MASDEVVECPRVSPSVAPGGPLPAVLARKGRLTMKPPRRIPDDDFGLSKMPNCSSLRWPVRYLVNAGQEEGLMPRKVLKVVLGVTAVLYSADILANPRLISRCLLQVDGKTYINGRCKFEPSEGGGFSIYGTNKWFAVINVYDGKVMVSWNNDEGFPASHAHDDLGPLSRDGACFVGQRAKVCAHN